MLRIALTKGRVEKKFIPLLQRCNIDCQPLIDKQRRLIINLGDQYQIILVKGEDVCTYLRKGAVDLGVVVVGDIGGILGEDIAHNLIDGVIALFLQCLIDR